MAFRADLKFDEWDFRVLDYHYNLNRPIDINGHPTGRVRGGQCTFVVEVVPGQSFWKYILENKVAPTCKLVLRGGKEDYAVKTIEFTDCYVHDMTESFSSVGGQPATIQFSITCAKMNEDGAKVENEWDALAQVR